MSSDGGGSCVSQFPAIGGWIGLGWGVCLCESAVGAFAVGAFLTKQAWVCEQFYNFNCRRENLSLKPCCDHLQYNELVHLKSKAGGITK
jgi:hypothetical protein